jgi:RNA polymerase sigma factor (sigma-70 family)
MADRELRPLINRLLHTVGMDGGQLSDGQLLERFVLAEDEAAFESLMWRHGPMVLALGQRMLRRRHDAEDVFQAVFLVLFRKAHSISQRDSVASWLYKVAYRLAAKMRARTAKQANDASLVESLAAPEQPCTTLAADLRAILDDALSRLPEKYRQPLVLHYLEGKTIQQVAVELGRPPGTVSGRLSRARELLRQRLARRGAALPSAVVSAALVRVGKAAPVAATLTSATLGAVRGVPARSASTGTVSATALALAESATWLGPVARWKIATLVLVVLGLAGLGTGLAGWRQEAPKLAATDFEAPVSWQVPRPAGLASPPPVAPVDDPLPPGARARLGSQRFTYGADLSALAVSPDGATVAGIGQTNSVVFWDATTGKRQTMISATDTPVPAQVCAVDFSPDGVAVALGDTSGRAVVIPSWKDLSDTEPAECINERHAGAVKVVRFAPDGQTVASAGDDGVVRLWIPTTGQVLHTLVGHCGALHGLAFAPDGKTLASAGEDGTIRLWDPATGKLRRTCCGHTGRVRALAFSTDSQVLGSAGTDRHVFLWRPDADKPFADYNLRTVEPLALAFVDEQRLVVASEAGGVRLFDVAANKLLCDYRGLLWAVHAVACSRDGRKLVAGGQDGVFLRWDVASGKADEHPTLGHRGPVFGVDVSPDGRMIASAGLDGTVRLWDLVSGRALETYQPSWQTPSGHGYFSAVAFVESGRSVAAAGADGTIYLWDCQKGTGTHWQAHQGKVTALASRGGRFLVSAGADGAVCLWEPATGAKVRTYGGGVSAVNRLAISPDDTQVVGVDADRQVHVWELATGKPLGPVAGKGSGLAVAAFSPANASLGAGGPLAALHLWRPQSGAYIPSDTWEGDDRRAMAMAFAPDGTLAVAGPDGIIRLWKRSGAEEIGRFAGHQNRINELAFTPDGKSLVSASDDGTVLIWAVP